MREFLCWECNNTKNNKNKMRDQQIYKRLHYGESEFRYDLLRNEWVIVAKECGKKPQDFFDSKFIIEKDSDVDVLELLESDDASEIDTLVYKDKKQGWTTKVFENKYPMLIDKNLTEDVSEGPFPAFSASGVHEIVVKNNGEKPFADMEIVEIAEVLDAYQDRYLSLMKDKNIKSINIFHNHGESAGGSINHPHSQIIALPIIASSVERELIASERYMQKNKINLFDTMRDYEMQVKKRIVYENEDYVLYCPFASRKAFSMRIVPKKTNAYFERITDIEKLSLADALREGINALNKGLNSPDYNFYLHTAPCSGREYEYYSYFLDIYPKTQVYAGFEIATDIDIVPISPEDSASFLRDFIEIDVE